MKEIKCPHCGKTFTPSVDEYNDLLSQVRNEQFEIEISHVELAEECMERFKKAMEDIYES